MAAVTPDFFRIRVNPPSQFGGGDSEKFDDWIEHFRSYIAIVDHELMTSLDTVEKDLDRVILLSDYVIRGNSPEQNEAFRQKGRNLHFLLTSLLKDNALNVIRGDLDQNGFESYRKVLKKYQSEPSARAMGRLSRILNPHWDKSQTFEDHFTEWEKEVYRFERESMQPIQDFIKNGIITAQSRGALQEHLRLNVRTSTS